MSFQCLECSYAGNKFIAGACPSCGSNRIKRLGKPPDSKPTVAKRSYRTMLGVALWLYLFYKGLVLAGVF